MANQSREKILGQYFSGDRIPQLLASLLRLEDVEDAIDPMCGRGDMFGPLLGHNINFYGIEIDGPVAAAARQSYPDAEIITGNAFRRDTILSVAKGNGFDLVITNPPYVRRELINPVSSNGFHDTLDTIKQSLIEVLDSFHHIPAEDKTAIESCIYSISNFADLSIPSWILCLMLLKPGGQLALVVPTAWMNREYARPIIDLLNRLCSVEYIIVDVNRVWFKNNAQVQTSLVVARRNSSGDASVNKKVKYVRMFSCACSADSLTGNLPDGVDFTEYAGKGRSLPGYFEVNTITAECIVSNEDSAISQRSKLRNFVGHRADSFLTFAYLKVNIGQGLRTGANRFFYLKRVDGNCNSTLFYKPVEYISDLFYPVVKNQDALTDSYAVTEVPDDVVLYIQNAILQEDMRLNGLYDHYSELPASVAEYITAASQITIKDKLIPELSAVKTNVTKGTPGRPQRFWYMLPLASDRQYATVFLPRINSGESIARINLTGHKIFLDANFTNFWLQPSSPLTEFSLLALLNSTWLKIQFEEIGSIMGGGALKLDAVQIKKCVFPARILERIPELDVLGQRLAKSGMEHSRAIIRQIDSIIMDALSIDVPAATETLESILNSYLSCRN